MAENLILLGTIAFFNILPTDPAHHDRSSHSSGLLERPPLG